MITRRELEVCINECENAPQSYQNCAKLATFYTIHDHLYGENKSAQETQEINDNYGDSDFLKLIEGKSAQNTWLVIDELMETVQVTNPRLYDSVIRKLKQTD